MRASRASAGETWTHGRPKNSPFRLPLPATRTTRGRTKRPPRQKTKRRTPSRRSRVSRAFRSARRVLTRAFGGGEAERRVSEAHRAVIEGLLGVHTFNAQLAALREINMMLESARGDASGLGAAESAAAATAATSWIARERVVARALPDVPAPQAVRGPALRASAAPVAGARAGGRARGRAAGRRVPAGRVRGDPQERLRAPDGGGQGLQRRAAGRVVPPPSASSGRAAPGARVRSRIRRAFRCPLLTTSCWRWCKGSPKGTLRARWRSARFCCGAPPPTDRRAGSPKGPKRPEARRNPEPRTRRDAHPRRAARRREPPRRSRACWSTTTAPGSRPRPSRRRAGRSRRSPTRTNRRRSRRRRLCSAPSSPRDARARGDADDEPLAGDAHARERGTRKKGLKKRRAEMEREASAVKRARVGEPGYARSRAQATSSRRSSPRARAVLRKTETETARGAARSSLSARGVGKTDDPNGRALAAIVDTTLFVLKDGLVGPATGRRLWAALPEAPAAAAASRPLAAAARDRGAQWMTELLMFPPRVDPRVLPRAPHGGHHAPALARDHEKRLVPVPRVLPASRAGRKPPGAGVARRGSAEIEDGRRSPCPRARAAVPRGGVPCARGGYRHRHRSGRRSGRVGGAGRLRERRRGRTRPRALTSPDGIRIGIPKKRPPRDVGIPRTTLSPSAPFLADVAADGLRVAASCDVAGESVLESFVGLEHLWRIALDAPGDDEARRPHGLRLRDVRRGTRSFIFTSRSRRIRSTPRPPPRRRERRARARRS